MSLDPPLLTAASAGDVEQIRSLLAKGHHLNAVDERGRTPLWCAVRLGQAATVEALLDLGADPLAHATSLTDRAWTPPKSGGPRPTARGTLLHDAASANRHEVIDLLVRRGFDVNARDQDGTTALGMACFTGSVEAARALLSRGASANAEDDRGHSPIDIASTREIVAALLEHGASPQGRPDHAETPLGRYVILGKPDVVATLLSAGASANAPHERRTPLAWAAGAGNARIAKALLTAGAEIDGRAQEQPAMYYAAFAGHDTLIDLLLARGAKDLGSALHAAAGAGHAAIVQKLLTAGAPIEHREWSGTPLHAAAMGGRTAAIRHLLLAGAKIEAKNRDGETALLLAAAAATEAIETVKALLDAGADANARTTEGKLLYDAVKARASLRVLSLLRDRGAVYREKAPVVEAPPPPSEPSGPGVGGRVKHIKFGEGAITTIQGLGEAQKFTVAFDVGGSKVLLARFLTPVP